MRSWPASKVEAVNLSRHRRYTLIFDIQNPAHLDRNIVSEADVVMQKEPGTTQPRIERSQLRPTINAARAAFAGVGPFRRKRVVWVVAPNDGVSGQLMENVLTHLMDKRSDQDLWRGPTANGQNCDRTWSANNNSRSTRPEDLSEEQVSKSKATEVFWGTFATGPARCRE